MPDLTAPSYVRRVLSTVLMVGALVGLAVLGWFAMEESRGPKSLEDLPVVKANNEPFKIKPDDPGGAKIPNKNRVVFDVASGKRLNAKADEPTTLNALVEQKDDKWKEVQPAAGEPDKKEEPKRTIQDVLIEKMDKPKTNLKTVSPNYDDDKTLKTLKKEEIKPAKVVAPKPAPKPEPEPKKIVVTAPKKAEPKPAPVKKEEPKLSIPKPKSLIWKEKQQQKLASADAAPAKPLPASIRNKTINGSKVQLGSFRTTDDLTKSWDNLRSKYSSELNGLTYTVQTVTLDDKGTFHRLHVGPLNSADAAQDLCSKLKAKGQACLVVK